MWGKAHRVKHYMRVQESRLDAEETFEMKRKYIRNSLLQTRIEKQRETSLNVKQEIATVVNTRTTKFYTVNEMTEGSSDKLLLVKNVIMRLKKQINIPNVNILI